MSFETSECSIFNSCLSTERIQFSPAVLSKISFRLDNSSAHRSKLPLERKTTVLQQPNVYFVNFTP